MTSFTVQVYCDMSAIELKIAHLIKEKKTTLRGFFFLLRDATIDSLEIIHSFLKKIKIKTRKNGSVKIYLFQRHTPVITILAGIPDIAREKNNFSDNKRENYNGVQNLIIFFS